MINITVVVPSEDRMQTAGVRIRYIRIMEFLRQYGVALSIEAADNISINNLTSDVYLISKVHDVRAILLMTAARSQNKIVGVDFFDNYFESTDPRLQRLWDWALDVSKLMDFALCATENMKSVLERELHGNYPCLIINDPYETFEPEILADLIDEKIARLQHTKVLHLSWFGIASNNYFPVGISDLVAFRNYLTPLQNSGYHIRLTVMSNFKSQPNSLYAMLARMSLTPEIIEWSEEGEKQLLSSSLASFLPVNGQGFSTVKSLNRAVSALTNGSQVLSAGFPIYQSLAPFIYRDGRVILSDVVNNCPLLRRDTLHKLKALFETLGDPAVEARQLAIFLKGLVNPVPQVTASIDAMVVVGRRTPPAILEYAQRQDLLVVATPFSRNCDNFDARVATSGESCAEPQLELHSSAIDKLDVSLKQYLTFDEGASPVGKLAIRHLGEGSIVKAIANLRPTEKGPSLIDYAPAMRAITTLLKRAFPNKAIFTSEWEAPFSFSDRISTYQTDNTVKRKQNHSQNKRKNSKFTQVEHE